MARSDPARILPMEEPKSSGGALAAFLGSTVAAVALVVSVTQWEGKETRAYRDIVGVWTICYGDTANVQPGQVATDAECQARLERQLIAHAKPVMQCVPGLAAKGREYALAASASLAYNIGPGAFCRSTAARRFNAGDWRGGCDAFLAWNRAGGRVIRGLDNRRRAERALCLKAAA